MTDAYISIDALAGKCASCVKRPWPSCGYNTYECSQENGWGMWVPDNDQLVIEDAIESLQELILKSKEPMRQYINIVNRVAAIRVPKGQK